MFLELGRSTPRGQVRSFLFLTPLELKVEGKGQAATTLIGLGPKQGWVCVQGTTELTLACSGGKWGLGTFLPI